LEGWNTIHQWTQINTNEGLLIISRILLGTLVDTPEGYRAVRKVQKNTINFTMFVLDTMDRRRVIFNKYQCFFTPSNELVLGKKLKEGDWIQTKKGKSRIHSITKMSGVFPPFYYLKTYSHMSKYFLSNGILVGRR